MPQLKVFERSSGVAITMTFESAEARDAWCRKNVVKFSWKGQVASPDCQIKWCKSARPSLVCFANEIIGEESHRVVICADCAEALDIAIDGTGVLAGYLISQSNSTNRSRAKARKGCGTCRPTSSKN